MLEGILDALGGVLEATTSQDSAKMRQRQKSTANTEQSEAPRMHLEGSSRRLGVSLGHLRGS